MVQIINTTIRKNKFQFFVYFSSYCYLHRRHAAFSKQNCPPSTPLASKTGLFSRLSTDPLNVKTPMDQYYYTIYNKGRYPRRHSSRYQRYILRQWQCQRRKQRLYQRIVNLWNQRWYPQFLQQQYQGIHQ